jgi:type IV pilus assembly protein PilW
MSVDPSPMRQRPGPVRMGRGMTLVELMVGIAVGLFLVAVMGTVYVGSKTTFLVQEATSRLQENGRFAMDTLSQDLRMSGFRGCQASSGLTNALNTPTALLYNFAEPIWGARHTGGGWSPALPAPLSGLGARSEGDVLLVRRPFGSGWALVAAMPDASAALTVTPTTQILQGDLLMVADCAAAAVLQATNAAPGPSGTVLHQSSAAGITPGVAKDSLGRAFANDALVWRMQTLAYYLADSQRRPGERALWVYRHPAYGAAQQTELVTGVQALGVVYGLDTDGDFAADRFASADQVANWAQVVNARIELLLVGSRDAASTQPQTYTFNGSTVTPTDRRLRTVMSMLVSLRNAVP